MKNYWWWYYEIKWREKRQFKDRNIKEVRLGREENEKNKKETCGKREGRGDRKLEYINIIYECNVLYFTFL